VADELSGGAEVAVHCLEDAERVVRSDAEGIAEINLAKHGPNDGVWCIREQSLAASDRGRDRGRPG
jgi:hypothetical protein